MWAAASGAPAARMATGRVKGVIVALGGGALVAAVAVGSPSQARQIRV